MFISCAMSFALTACMFLLLSLCTQAFYFSCCCPSSAHAMQQATRPFVLLLPWLAPCLICQRLTECFRHPGSCAANAQQIISCYYSDPARLRALSFWGVSATQEKISFNIMYLKHTLCFCFCIVGPKKGFKNVCHGDFLLKIAFSVCLKLCLLQQSDIFFRTTGQRTFEFGAIAMKMIRWIWDDNY